MEQLWSSCEQVWNRKFYKAMSINLAGLSHRELSVGDWGKRGVGEWESVRVWE